MTVTEVLKHVSTGYQVCKGLKITPSNWYKWEKQNWIPLVKQRDINKVFNLDLPIDFTKKEMEDRIKN